MKKQVKKLMSGMLVFSMLVSGVAAFQSSPAAAATESEKPQATFVGTCTTVSSFMSNIQYKKFMSYLTSEYAPEMKAEWEKAIDERQNVKPVIDIKAGSENAAAINSPLPGGLKFTPASPEELNKALENTKLPEGAKVEAYKIETPDGDGKQLSMVTVTTKNESVNDESEKAKLDDKEISISITEAPGGENYAAQLQLEEELDKAITNNDGQAIKTVLGKMLTNYKKVTEELKNTVSNVENTNK